jgi:hypothetical protein
MNIAIIKTLGKNNFLKCYNSLKKTINISQHKIKIFSEKKTRGFTLNTILKKFGTKENILIVADDVQFTSGWYQKLKKNEAKAEMWGTSMLYPKTNIIQDNGYEIVKVNNNTFLRPLKRGRIFKNQPKKEWKYVDSACGCFLYLNKKVFKLQKKFYPKYGMNRWDELTFTQKAKSKGLRLAVLNHYMFHEGISTKIKKNINLSSISYQIEKKLWRKLENKFIEKNQIDKKIEISFDSNVFKTINNKKNNILLYGAGIFSENIILSDLIQNKQISFTSILKEEIGKKLVKKYKIFDFNKLIMDKFNTVIITPYDVADSIYEKLFYKWISNNWNGKIFKVIEIKNSYTWKYKLNEIKL